MKTNTVFIYYTKEKTNPSKNEKDHYCATESDVDKLIRDKFYELRTNNKT